MRKKLFMLTFSGLLMNCSELGNTKSASDDSAATNSKKVSYTKNDLQKIKWIEGKWKGMYKNKPFYEIYQFINDTTIEIISFDWNGKDSSNSSRSFVLWKDGVYYLGDQLNWKVTEISDKEIKMLPHYKASNDILWRYNDSTSWDAILDSKKETNEYHMQAFDPFKN